MMSDEYDPGSSGAEDPCGRKRRRRAGGISLGGGRLFPGLKEFVVHLLTFRSEAYSDTDFAERTLMNLGRKITKYGDSELSEWEKCVRLRDPNSGCVRVSRPRDSRMAVSRTPGGGVKKVYPAIIVSQIFRFPQVVFHNDIRSVRECSHQAPVKKERPVSEDNEDLICVNPYHYEMTLEAYARLKKKASKPQSNWQNKSKSKGSSKSNSNNSSTSSTTSSTNNATTATPTSGGTSHGGGGSSGETTSSNNSSSEPSSTPRPFIESELLRDLQFYDLNKRKAIQDLENLKLLGIRNGIRSVVKDKYPKLPVQGGSGESGENTPMDEGLIQNLLEDIRGSFERQFDDDLTALASGGVMGGSFYSSAVAAGQESPWAQSQAAVAAASAVASSGHHPPEGWNPAAAAASNYLNNVDFDHYFPPGAGGHPHPVGAGGHPHPMSAYHHLHHHHAAAAAAAASHAAAAAASSNPQQSVFTNNYDSNNGGGSAGAANNGGPPPPSSSYPYDATAAAYGSLQ